MPTNPIGHMHGAGKRWKVVSWPSGVLIQGDASKALQAAVVLMLGSPETQHPNRLRVSGRLLSETSMTVPTSVSKIVPPRGSSQGK